MTDHVIFGLLPEQTVNRRSFSAGCITQVLLLVVLVRIVQPTQFTAPQHLSVTHLVLQSDMTRATPTVHVSTPIAVTPRKIAPPRLPRLEFPDPPSLVASAKPTLPPIPVEPARPAPPSLKTEAFLPVVSAPTINKSIDSLKVQTGGFGDPNGVRGHGDSTARPMIASLGAFDLPSGPGRGNGRGGAHGIAGIGQASGFADASAPAMIHQNRASNRSGITTPIEVIAKPKPDYSEEGRQLRIEGEVQLEVVFTASGQVHALKVIRGLGHGLDEQAIRAAEQMKFRPAMHEGQPVDSTAVVHIIFELAS